jgi:hypothetical protein
MEEYGITQDYIETHVRQLDYSSFRDHAAAAASEDGNKGEKEFRMNSWQERHALLLVKHVKEIDELRYVLCPKYMNDGEFWETYFELMKEHLPKIAFTWKEGCPLPKRSMNNSNNVSKSDSFEYLESHLRTLHRKASSAVAKAGESTGVDVSKLFGQNVEIDAVASDSDVVGGNSGIASRTTMLDVDPDLEEYLGDEDDGEGAPEDDDLDEYLNELTGAYGGTSVASDGAPEHPEGQGDEDIDIKDEDIEALIQDIQLEDES